jgi:DNA-binding transcriptional ArsR family regulator
MSKKPGRPGPRGKSAAGGSLVRGRLETPVAAPTPNRWTFLTNHSHVLILLSQIPDLVLREVAARVGITERAVQRIIADLEEAGCIEIEKVGRRNRYRILDTRSLRHPLEAHHTLGDLVRMIIGD